MSEEKNTPTTQEKKSNKWLPISLVIFALAVLGFAGFFAYQNYQSPVPSPMPIPTEILSPTPMVDPTANWLTYTKENICYTFKYPKEVTLKERKEENIIHLSLWGPTQKKDTEFYDGLSLTFSLPLEIGNLSLNDYVDGKIEEVEKGGVAEITKSKKAVLVNEINGYTFTVQGLGTFQNIFLQSLDKTCTVEITNATIDPTNQGYQETVDKILSTFKFVD